MKNKKTSQMNVQEKVNISLVQPKIEVISDTRSKKELVEKEKNLTPSGNKDMELNDNKQETVKADRPFRSRLPKLKMFIPRRPKSSSRNRGEDTKYKAKTSQKKNYSPKPSPRANRKTPVETKLKQSPKPTHRKVENSGIQKPHLRNSPRGSPKLSTRSPVKRGACVSPSAIARNKSQNLTGPTTVELKTSQTEAIIEAALSPSPALSPLVTQKQQKDRENEQEKLRIINDILTANLPGACVNGSKINTNLQSALSRPSKIPVYQNSHVPNRYSAEVCTTPTTLVYNIFLTY